MNLFEVKKPGLFTTVQDLGRYGYQRYGVPVSGAMDNFAFMIANYLVGNDSNDACLETTLLGPELAFLCDSWIAVTGANVVPKLNGEEISCWETLRIRKGDLLTFGQFLGGCRAYLAVKGGINVPLVMNSRSTFTRSAFGGYKGRSLKAGDVVKGFKTKEMETGFALPKEHVPICCDELEVEVVLGPQTEYFSDEGVKTFLSSDYVVTTEFDRMGYRLNGPSVEYKGFLDMVSDAIPIGSVQVPSNGKPILIMRDAQTSGGYPKIGIITTPDVQRVGQAKPNNKIKFSQISTSKAKNKLLEYLRLLQNIKCEFIDLKLC